ncbi:MAG: hypothetical protein AMXMBFR13_51430 [Phycisphaerae bacterium]
MTNGEFALHGRPVDVLHDATTGEDLVLQYNRARYYDPQHGRWLQRDAIGYVDGVNLYEAFKGNALTNVDPSGEVVPAVVAVVIVLAIVDVAVAPGPDTTPAHIAAYKDRAQKENVVSVMTVLTFPLGGALSRGVGTAARSALIARNVLGALSTGAGLLSGLASGGATLTFSQRAAQGVWELASGEQVTVIPLTSEEWGQLGGQWLANSLLVGVSPHSWPRLSPLNSFTALPKPPEAFIISAEGEGPVLAIPHRAPIAANPARIAELQAMAEARLAPPESATSGQPAAHPRIGSLTFDLRGTEPFTATEINAAEVMTWRGYDVVLRTPVGSRAGGGTSDALLNGVPADIYAPVTGSPARIIGAILDKNSQLPTGGSVILDLRSTKVTPAELGDIMYRLERAAAKQGVPLNISEVHVIERY